MHLERVDAILADLRRPTLRHFLAVHVCEHHACDGVDDTGDRLPLFRHGGGVAKGAVRADTTLAVHKALGLLLVVVHLAPLVPPSRREQTPERNLDQPHLQRNRVLVQVHPCYVIAM